MARLLSLNEASDILAISPDAVRAHIVAGRLHGVNIGGGALRPRWRVTEEALEAFIAARTSAPAAATKRRKKQTGEVIQFFA